MNSPATSAYPQIPNPLTILHLLELLHIPPVLSLAYSLSALAAAGPAYRSAGVTIFPPTAPSSVACDTTTITTKSVATQPTTKNWCARFPLFYMQFFLKFALSCFADCLPCLFRLGSHLRYFVHTAWRSISTPTPNRRPTSQGGQQGFVRN